MVLTAYIYMWTGKVLFVSKHFCNSNIISNESSTKNSSTTYWLSFSSDEYCDMFAEFLLQVCLD